MLKRKINKNSFKKVKVVEERGSLYSSNLGFFSSLPEPIILIIFKFIKPRLKNIRLTCKLFHKFACRFWEQLIILPDLAFYIEQIRSGITYAPNTILLNIRNNYLFKKHKKSILGLKFLPVKEIFVQYIQYGETNSFIIKNLPSTLNKLTISNISLNDIKSLPESLKELTILFKGDDKFLNEKYFDEIPKYINFNILLDSRVYSPINWSISCNNTKLLKFLIDKGYDVNEKRINQTLPLVHAIHEQCIDCIEILLSNQANVNESCSIHQCVLLKCAISSGNIGLVNLLIKHGANIKLKGQHFFIDALRNADILSMFKCLIQHGADPNEYNILTTIICLFGSSRMDLVKFLLENGANPNRITSQSSTLYHASNFNEIEIVNLLLEHKADVNLGRIKENETPIFIASKEGHAEVVKILLQNGADMNIPNIYDITPLEIAKLKNKTKVVNLLNNWGKK
jgi:ankyrin repeat protein